MVHVCMCVGRRKKEGVCGWLCCVCLVSVKRETHARTRNRTHTCTQHSLLLAHARTHTFVQSLLMRTYVTDLPSMGHCYTTPTPTHTDKLTIHVASFLAHAHTTLRSHIHHSRVMTHENMVDVVTRIYRRTADGEGV